MIEVLNIKAPEPQEIYNYKKFLDKNELEVTHLAEFRAQGTKALKKSQQGPPPQK